MGPPGVGTGGASLALRGRGWEIEAKADPDGRFAVHGLPDTPFLVTAWVFGANRWYGDARADSPREGIELEVKPANR